jgi:hypothetical protein
MHYYSSALSYAKSVAAIATIAFAAENDFYREVISVCLCDM